METNRLNQFRIVAKTQNLRESAELLNMTHAGLAKSIRVLERELGVRLITKDGRGIKITPQGQALLTDMSFCMEAEERLKRKAIGLDLENKRKVRIGTFEVFSTYLAHELVSALPKESDVSFLELTPGELEDALVRGEVDYGITYLIVPRGELDFISVGKIRMGIFGLKKFENFDFSDLPFVVPSASVQGTPTKVRGLDGWPDDRITRNIRFSVALMETALSLVRQGQGVGYFPEFVVERHNQVMRAEFSLQEIGLPERIDRLQPVFAIKRKDREEVASFRSLCKVLRTL